MSPRSAGKSNTRSKLTIFLIIAALGVAAFYIISFGWGAYHFFTNTGLPSPMVTFESQNFHISIDHPKTWAVFELLQGNHGDMEAILHIGFATPAGSPRLLIAERTFAQPDLEEIARWGEMRLRNESINNEILVLGPITVPSNQALQRQYFRNDKSWFGMNTDKFKCMDWYTMSGSTGYDLSFCTYEKYWPVYESVFLQMANSFEAK